MLNKKELLAELLFFILLVDQFPSFSKTVKIGSRLKREKDEYHELITG